MQSQEIPRDPRDEQLPGPTWPGLLRRFGRATCTRGELRPAFQWVRPGELPAIYSQESNPDAVAAVKLFTPDGCWTWYLIEHDGADSAFGLVVGLEPELGYVDLAELAAVRGPMGLPIERDLYWTPKPWREIQKELEAR